MSTYLKSVVAQSVVAILMVAKSVSQSHKAKTAYLGKQPQLNQGQYKNPRHTAVLCLQVHHEQDLACVVLTKAKHEAERQMNTSSNNIWLTLAKVNCLCSSNHA